jgi:hypothetical protein
MAQERHDEGLLRALTGRRVAAVSVERPTSLFPSPHRAWVRRGPLFFSIQRVFHFRWTGHRLSGFSRQPRDFTISRALYRLDDEIDYGTNLFLDLIPTNPNRSGCGQQCFGAFLRGCNDIVRQVHLGSEIVRDPIIRKDLTAHTHLCANKVSTWLRRVDIRRLRASFELRRPLPMGR